MTSAAQAAAPPEPIPDPLLAAILAGHDAPAVWLDPGRLGDFCVNAALFEHLARLAPAQATRAREGLARTISSQDAARLAGWATYGIPRPVGAPSLDTGATYRHFSQLEGDKEGKDRAARRERDATKERMAVTIDAIHGGYDWIVGLDHWGMPVSAGQWLRRRGSALRACRVAYAFREATCGVSLVRPFSCRVRGCPDCERARAARLVDHYAAAAEAMANPAIVTVTIRNVEGTYQGLRAGLDRLRDGWARVQRRAIFRGGRCKGWRSRHADAIAKHGWRGHEPVAGGLSSVEVTDGDVDGRLHPHLHALVDCKWLDQRELSDAWRQVSGDGSYIVDIRRVRGSGKELRAALAEVLKYVAKPSARLIDPERPDRLAALLLAMKDRRLVNGFGSMHGLKFDPDLDDEDTVPVEDPNDPFLVHSLPAICPYCGAEGDWEQPVRINRADAYRAPPARAGGRPPPLAWREAAA